MGIPYILSQKTPTPGFFQRYAISSWIGWVIGSTLVTAILVWLQETDRIPLDFDISIISYIGGLALSSFFFNALGALITEQGILPENRWKKSVDNTGDFNSAIGALPIAKSVRVTQVSNNFLFAAVT